LGMGEGEAVMIDRVSLATRPVTLQPPASLPKERETAGKAASFKELFYQQLEAVNQLQIEAEVQAQRLARGEAESLHEVMIAAAKAQLALDLTVALRNKVLEAYQEISRMQL